jgi:hypothetical protein
LWESKKEALFDLADNAEATNLATTPATAAPSTVELAWPPMSLTRIPPAPGSVRPNVEQPVIATRRCRSA